MLVADFFHFIPGYRHYVFQPGREPLFFLLLAFLLTFAAARTYTRLSRLRVAQRLGARSPSAPLGAGHRREPRRGNRDHRLPPRRRFAAAALLPLRRRRRA